jgi:hypothetical protein
MRGLRILDCFRGDDYSSQQDQEDFPNSTFFPFLANMAGGLREIHVM